jgi:hypothetical protein
MQPLMSYAISIAPSSGVYASLEVPVLILIYAALWMQPLQMTVWIGSHLAAIYSS